MGEFVHVTAKELGACPAAINMYDGVIEINTSVWDKFTDFEKQFIIEHERGHYKLQTDSEQVADAYALRKVYGTHPGSLKKTIKALYKVGIINAHRLKHLYIEALQIDATENNNPKAIEELKHLGIKNMKMKKSLQGSSFVTKGKNYVTDMEMNITEENSLKGSGFTLFGKYYFSYSNFLLACILVATIRILCKMR